MEKKVYSQEELRYYRFADAIIIFALFAFLGFAVMIHFS